MAVRRLKTSASSTLGERLNTKEKKPGRLVSTVTFDWDAIGTKEKSLLRQIKGALAKSSLPEQMHEPVLEELRRKVGEFRTDTDNRDGRGVTQPAGRRIQNLLTRVLHAIGHAQEHPNGNVRREAKKLVRSCQHESFEQIETRAKRLVGLLRRIGHQRNEELQNTQAARLPLDGGTEIVEVRTVDSLRSAGGELDLCVAKRDDLARGYHQRLAHGESKFYKLVEGGQAKLLMEVDKKKNEVSEISARSNGKFELSRKRALRILEAVGATADREPAFADVGAFSPYLSGGKPDGRIRLTVNGCRYRVDAFAKRRQVIVREQSLSRGRVRWSLFQREAPHGEGLVAWKDVYLGGVGLGQFAELPHHRKVAAMINRLFD